MKTISSEKSLILWPQNINNSNITIVDNLFLKENYLSIFDQLKTLSSNDGPKAKFLDMWHYVMNEECDALFKKLIAITTEKDLINLVINKFRGNVGEIFVEKIFLDFGMNFDIVPSSYNPVDPTNEEFIDGQGIHPSDSLPIGVQIKNYTKHFKGRSNCVSRETFVKSMAMTTHWAQDNKLIDSSKLIKFFSIPRQIIFSFTDVEDQRLLEDYKGSVRFIGPNQIKKLDLENKSYIFENICNEISSL